MQTIIVSIEQINECLIFKYSHTPSTVFAEPNVSSSPQIRLLADTSKKLNAPLPIYLLTYLLILRAIESNPSRSTNAFHHWRHVYESVAPRRTVSSTRQAIEERAFDWQFPLTGNLVFGHAARCRCLPPVRALLGSPDK